MQVAAHLAFWPDYVHQDLTLVITTCRGSLSLASSYHSLHFLVLMRVLRSEGCL